MVRSLHRFLSHKWYFDTVYNRLINQPILECGYRVVFALMDKGLLEAIGPTGLGVMSFKAGAFITALQSGRVYDYAWVMVCFVYFYTIIENVF
jgi:NADH-quinone oxidoreductase subunit L